MKLISFHNVDQVETTKSELPESATAAKSDTLEGLTEKQIFYQYAVSLVLAALLNHITLKLTLNQFQLFTHLGKYQSL